MAIQTWGIPPQTWDVGEGGVKPHRVVQQDGTNYRTVVMAESDTENLIGVVPAARDAKDSVAVRQIGEAYIECSEPLEIGDRLVVAADGDEPADRGRVCTEGVAGAGTTLVGIARSRTTAAGEKVEADLKLLGTAA